MVGLLFVWQCGGALWLPEPLGLCWLFCHPLRRYSASVGAVLCSLFGFFALGWVRFWPAVSAAQVSCEVCSLGCPSWLVLLLMSLFVIHLVLRVRLFGQSPLAPPAAPVCWPLVGSLLWHSVALASCCTLSFCCFRLAVPTVWLSKLLEFS